MQPHPSSPDLRAAKAAVIMFTRAVALEVAPTIRLAPCPGDE